VSPGGSARYLERGRGAPLGAAAGERYEEVRERLRPGSRLVLYTDGLIERRGGSIDDGIERLMAAARRHGHEPLEALCDALLDDLGVDAAEDDTALLCVERLAPDD
jgi:serine phosphatase RsbU (regulator of sigma subunit)